MNPAGPNQTPGWGWGLCGWGLGEFIKPWSEGGEDRTRLPVATKHLLNVPTPGGAGRSKTLLMSISRSEDIIAPAKGLTHDMSNGHLIRECTCYYFQSAATHCPTDPIALAQNNSWQSTSTNNMASGSYWCWCCCQLPGH